MTSSCGFEMSAQARAPAPRGRVIYACGERLPNTMPLVRFVAEHERRVAGIVSSRIAEVIFTVAVAPVDRNAVRHAGKTSSSQILGFG